MATSRTTGGGLLGYLESARNLAGCVGGAAGLVLHFTGVAGPWWPGAVAGLYGLGALLAPGRRPEGGGAPDPSLAPAPAAVHASVGGSAPGAVSGPGGGTTVLVAAPGGGQVRAALAELEAYLAGVDLPWSAGVEELLATVAGQARSKRAEVLRAAERVVVEQLPLAVDGYLRARAWERLSPGGVDPAVALGHEVERMAAALR